MTRTFDINLYDGHLIFNNNDHNVLVYRFSCNYWP